MKVHGHRMKNVPFSAMDAHYDATHFSLFVRVLCAKVVGATSSEGFLMKLVFGCVRVRASVGVYVCLNNGSRKRI